MYAIDWGNINIITEIAHCAVAYTAYFMPLTAYSSLWFNESCMMVSLVWTRLDHSSRNRNRQNDVKTYEIVQIVYIRHQAISVLCTSPSDNTNATKNDVPF